ncbi:predicted protein [Naegleria gruberi]|uniref:Predicted protein n=1 Tax=Naegleria gruberi TaxID=5762 RepID=D2W2H2_NAEGR|nr:uncharacterized protein NAEGRDRAFT_59932 [Naegleria gruberi]EFC36711.1 predicted protein [Naegleria gruberi]|eukprot:XP_002669455.1 predicted protein [Naegleria gruberi strain NEG-M]
MMIKSSLVTPMPSIHTTTNSMNQPYHSHSSSLHHSTTTTNNNNHHHNTQFLKSNQSSIDAMFRKLMEAKFSSTLSDIESNFNQFDNNLSSTLKMIESDFKSLFETKKRGRIISSDTSSTMCDQDDYSTASGSKKRKRSNFSKKDKELLIEWLQNHSDYPYPSDEEKDELLERVSMTKDQLETWFVNNRKRLLPTATARKTPAMLQCEEFNTKLEKKLVV